MADQDTPQPEREDTAAPGADALAELKARVAHLEEQLKWAHADLDNLRKRMAREIEQLRAEERARVAAEWLPVLDNLDLALEHASADPDAIVEGVRTVRDQALGVLTRLGFPRRSDAGTPFDPVRHEAVAAVADPDHPAGTVIRVVRPGYGDDEHQLRPAAVVVATKGE
jgi:molecular chaperone GrpE